jgi:plasmid stabilization system protein ParE
VKRYRIIISPEAEAQLATIYRYVADGASPEIALRFTSKIVERCRALESFPSRGTPRDDLRHGIRTIVFRRRTIIAYRVLDAVVEVLGIFHGGQDYEGLLRDPH